MKHYITKYKQGGKWYMEAWLQIDIFGKCFCFWKVKERLNNGGRA